jgi:hypothetical protein
MSRVFLPALAAAIVAACSKPATIDRSAAGVSPSSYFDNSYFTVLLKFIDEVSTGTF